jgi:hypothetical protein
MVIPLSTTTAGALLAMEVEDKVPEMLSWENTERLVIKPSKVSRDFIK